MMEEVQSSQASFDFCHNPHPGSLLQGLQEMRSDDQLVDVSLCVSGKEIPCHRNVLAACSEYFRAMFCNGHRESKECKIIIQEVNSNVMQLLVDYAYTSKVTITEGNAVELLEGANFFQILPVRDACVTYISNNLSAKECLQMLQVGNMLSCSDLEDKARLCALKEFAVVCKTPAFLTLTKDQLTTLVSSDDLNATEEVVYEAVMTWINHDTRKRKKEMKELMELIRFPFMDRLYFMENVESNDAVRKACQDIVTETRRYQLFPGEVQSPRTRPRLASRLRETAVVIGGTERQGTGDENPAVISNAIMTTMYADPSDDDWFSTTRMKRNNDSGFAVAVLGKSDIIVSTGTSFAKDVWLYQPELDSWSRLARMNINRHSHKLAVVQGKVYAIGGKDGIFALADVEIYDRSQNKWTRGIPLPEKRYHHAAVVLDGNIYVMGGFDAEGQATSTVYRFTPGDSEWEKRRNMPVVGGHVNASVLNGTIYVAGLHVGGYMYSFKPSEDWYGVKWIELSARVPSMCGMTVYKGKIYICGGNDKGKGTDVVWSYDPETKLFGREGNMSKGLYGHACVTILKCF